MTALIDDGDGDDDADDDGDDDAGGVFSWTRPRGWWRSRDDEVNDVNDDVYDDDDDATTTRTR